MERLYNLKTELRNKNGKPYAERDYVPLDFDIKNEKSQGFLNFNEIPDYDPIFSDVILTTSSKEVDVIQDWGAIQGTGMILSDNLKEIFDRFKLPPHKYYPLTVLHPKKGLLKSPQFYWLQVVTKDFLDLIDFAESKVYLSKILSPEPEEKVWVKSKEDYLGRIKELFLVSFESLCIKEMEKYDLFYLNRISSDCYISDKLRNEIEIGEIKGILIDDLSEDVFTKS